MSDSDKSDFPKALIVWAVTICSLLLLMHIDSTIDEIGIIGTSLVITFMAYITIWYLNEYPDFSLRSDSIKYGAIIGLLFFASLSLASHLILDDECEDYYAGEWVYCPRLVPLWGPLFTVLEITLVIVGFFGGIGLIGFYFSENKRIREQKEYAEITRRNRQEQEYREGKIKEADAYFKEGGLSNLQKASGIYTNLSLSTPREIIEEIAKEKEILLDFKGALSIFEELGLHKDAKRIRQKMREEGKVNVDQTVVHGDYVDDRDTIVKDSVINRSNVGDGGDDKLAKIKELKELLDSGAINEDDYEKMKREIIG